MARRTVTPRKGKDYQQGVKLGSSGWMLLPGAAGFSGTGGEPQTTPVATDDETYLLPGDTPPPSITIPIMVIEPQLDVYQDIQDFLNSGDPVQYVRESKKAIPILTAPSTAMVEVPAAAADPVVGKGWKELAFTGAGSLNWESDSRLKAGMVIDITGGEDLVIQHIGPGDGTAAKVYVSGDAVADAAATFAVKIGRRRQGPILCTVTSSPTQTDEVSPDSQHSGTLTVAPTGTVPKWVTIADDAGLLD